MADVGALVDAIQGERELRSALAHREALPGVAPKFESGLPVEFEALEPLLAEQKIRDLYTQAYHFRISPEELRAIVERVERQFDREPDSND